MTSPSTGRFSRAARAVFAELVARAEQGGPIDVEREIAAHPEMASELRALHARWSRVEGWLDGLAADEAALDSIERALRGPAPLDPATEAELARLADPDRARRRYERIELVASGGMGEVWRVRDRDLGRELAQKRLKTRSRDPRLLRRFLAEARLTARLEHPGIVPVHDAGIDEDGRVWFTMPLVRGENLARLLRPGGAALPEVLECLLKACDAVAYAHARGVVHRDLKPANVLLGAFGEVYVVDWGLAQSRDAENEPATAAETGSVAPSAPDETRHGDVLGTPAYMPPEQAAGRAGVADPRVDVYALGAILWHALARRPPYAASNGAEVVELVLAGAPESLASAAPDAPPELVAIADKAMSRDPSARYADLRALAEDLRAFVAGRVVRAHRTGAIPELVKWCRRNRALAATIVLATLALVGGAWAWSWQRERDAAEILRLADVARLSELERRANDLGPANPSERDAFAAWLRDAAELAARRSQHETALSALRAQGRLVGGAWTFDSDRDVFRHGLLTQLVDGLERLSGPGGAITLVREKLALAGTIEDESLVGAHAAWERAIAEVAAEPRYRGLVLAPIIGLVPIGRDPETGLQEFAHLSSGSPAERGPDRRVRVDASTGIVLVLVPGGRFHLGANRSGAASDGVAESWAGANEGPRRQFDMAPFLIAKHELTRAQWRMLGGAGAVASETDALLPAVEMTWEDAQRTLARAGLRLPTEAQWEYAARGGTTTRWWTGNEAGTLRGAANGRPSSSSGSRVAVEAEPVEVDALRANDFGLVHVAGNVAEWTLDPWSVEATINLRELDGLRMSGDATRRAVRGGSYASEASELRSTARADVQVDLRDRRIGVRACCRL